MASPLNDPFDDATEMHEINITPFIDVMLVLLIIFMIAAPLATVDIAVDLPATAAQPQPRPDKPIFLTIKADLDLVVGETQISRDAMAEQLDRLTGNDREQTVFLRADKAVAYGDLMDVLNALRDVGYLKVALVGLDRGATEP